MAVFDPDQRRIVVRVAYDGPAHAGKTTNLLQLCGFFTSLRRGELVRLEERAGRTLFFEWLQLDGGLVAGFPLRCHIVTVPGQAVLWHRRRHLLAKADAVAFVCDSAPAGIDVARRMLGDVWAAPGDGQGTAHVAVVQANKQDRAERLDPGVVAERLGLPPSIPVIAARACEGVGVRETLVLAMRAAANRAQREVAERGLEALAGRAESHEELRLALEAEDPGPTSAMTIALAAWGSVPAQPRRDAPAPDEPAPAREDLPPAPPAAVAVPEPAPQAHAAPPLPTPNVPLGFVWPAADGRAVLRGLAGCDAILREDLVGRHGTADGSGTSDTFIYQAMHWCLKTSLRRRYADVDAGRAALLRLARRKQQLGPLLPPQTVLCLQADCGAEAWLWTVTPWLTTLRASMTRADGEHDAAGLQVALEAYAQAAADALALTARARLTLDVHPSNFAITDGRVVYLDDDIGEGETAPTIGHALLRRVEEYGHRPAVVEAYLAGVESALAARLSVGEARSLGLEQALVAAIVRSDAGHAARRRLVAAVAGLRPAAPA